MNFYLLYTILFIIPNVYSYLYTYFIGAYIGDLYSFFTNLGGSEQFLSMVLSIIPYILLYIYFNRVEKNKKFILKKKSYLAIQIIIILILILNYMVYFFTNYGRAGNPNPLPFGTIILFLIPLKPGIYIYYALFREKKKISFFIIIFSFVIFEIFRGITISIFLLILLELIINKKNFAKKKYLLLEILSIFGIGIIYRYIYGIRNYIRGYEYLNLELTDGFNKFLGRISNYSNIAYIQENIDKITEINLEKNGKFFYVIEYIFIFLPKKALNLDSYQNLHDILSIDFINKGLIFAKNSSYITGITGKFLIVLNESIINGILFSFFIIIFVYIATLICRFYSDKNIIYLCFIQFLFVILSGSLMEMALNLYGYLVFLLIILFFNKLKR